MEGMVLHSVVEGKEVLLVDPGKEAWAFHGHLELFEGNRR